jgi:hypothetical protein
MSLVTHPECDHCGAEHDEWECIELRTPSGFLVVIDDMVCDIYFYSCHECALPNVWYEWKEKSDD